MERRLAAERLAKLSGNQKQIPLPSQKPTRTRHFVIDSLRHTALEPIKN